MAAEPNMADVWLTDCAGPGAQGAVSMWAHLVLPEEEQLRASRIVNPAARSRFLAAHLALRLVLAAGGLPVFSRHVFERGTHGKPFLPEGPEFSLSHSGDFALIAVSRHGPVGVDIEQLRTMTLSADWRGTYPALARFDSAPAGASERERFFQAWTRLEASCKRQGQSLAAVLDGVAALSPPPPEAHIHMLDVPKGYVAACVPSTSAVPECRILTWPANEDELRSGDRYRLSPGFTM